MSPAPHPNTTTAELTNPETINPETINRGQRRARLSVGTLYLLTGTVLGSWSARAPAIHDHLAVSDGLWGAGLTAASLAELLALTLVLIIIHAIAPRRLAITGALMVLAATPLLGWVSTMAQLVGVLACWFFAAQLMATPMGGMAIEVGRRYGRSLMASFAAVWTVGTALGAGLSTLAAAVEISLRVQFSATSVLLGVLVGISARWLPDSPATPASRSQTDSARPVLSGERPAWSVIRRMITWVRGRVARRGPLLRRWTPGMWLIAGLSVAGAYTASALGQWSALYVNDALHHDPALSSQAAAAVASGTVTAMFVAGAEPVKHGETRTVYALCI